MAVKSGLNKGTV